MRPEAADAAYLWDMLEACRAIHMFVAGRTLETYLSDPLLQAAVERKIEIIGEAARRVSKAFQEAHPEILWRPIMAQRHVLAHEYGEIQQDRIWRVAVVHVPALMELDDQRPGRLVDASLEFV